MNDRRTDLNRSAHAADAVALSLPPVLVRDVRGRALNPPQDGAHRAAVALQQCTQDEPLEESGVDEAPAAPEQERLFVVAWHEPRNDVVCI